MCNAALLARQSYHRSQTRRSPRGPFPAPGVVLHAACRLTTAALPCRLDASTRAADRYISQFPATMLSEVAKFLAFIAGSFAALLLFLTLLDDDLLERHLYGRNLVW